MRTLFIDIETTPNLAQVWGLWNQNVGLSQLVETTEMLCFVAAFEGGKPEFVPGRYHPINADEPDAGHAYMVARAHELLDEADAVVHYNGRRFDVPHLNREFLIGGLNPPSPFLQVDLLDTVKRRFRFQSNKLAHVTKQLGFPGKIGVDFDLWKACMVGDPTAWAKMRRYNLRDVTELAKVYNRLRPWIVGAPNVGLDPEHDGDRVCPTCGSERLIRRGYAYTGVSRFVRYQCRACGRYSRSGKREAGVDLRAVAE